MPRSCAKRAESAYERANVLHRRGRLAEAQALCHQALKLQPRYFNALQLSGVIDLQSNQPGRAVEAFGKALQIDPASATAHHNLGNANHLLMRYEAAVACYTRAIARDPTCADTYYNRGNSLLELKQIEAAIASYDEALRISPNHAEAWFNRGNGLLVLGRFAPAIASFERAIVVKPAHAEAYNNRGSALFRLQKFEAAVASFDEAIAITPTHSAAHGNRGNALVELSRYEAAVASSDMAIALQPDCAENHYIRGNALAGLNLREAAIASFDTATSLNPDHAHAHNSRGSALHSLQRTETALASFDAAIARSPGYAAAHYNRGNALRDLQQSAAAVASYDTAIALEPTRADAHNNRGVALRDLRQYAAAIASYDQAVALAPDLANAHYNRGNSLRDLWQHEAAVASYDRAISLDAGYADAYINRGEALKDLGRYAAAVASFGQGIALKPGYPGLHGQRQHARMLICDWTDFDAEVLALTARIGRSEAATSPFPLLGLSDSAALQKRAAELWVASQYPVHAALPPIPRRGTHDRIRIGYFSSDFGNHATMFLMAELFELHDRSRYEVWAFSFGPASDDAMRTRLLAACHVVDVASLSDQGVALLVRDLEIDIAVDLKGFTYGSRPGIFAVRAAPLQVNYLGYPGTTGAPCMDYLIADRALIPPGSEHHYSEKLVYLPRSYQVNDTKRAVGTRAFNRAELGLPPSGFVYCCFNNCFKITPGTFDIWMRILRRVEGSVLWLLEDNPQAARNLRQAAESRGVRADRLVFAKRMPLDEHLARHRAADLFLDTLPCNAHTTASDALWAGLPVLTRVGEAFASRVAASLLAAVDLPELITGTAAQYEELAVDLATHPEHLMILRQRLARHRLSAPLFDTPRYTKHLEAAYAAIHTRYHAGLPAADIFAHGTEPGAPSLPPESRVTKHGD